MSGSLNEYYVPHVQPNQSQFSQTPPPPSLCRDVNVNTRPPTPHLHNKLQITLISPSINTLDQSTQFNNVLIDGVVSLTSIQVLVDTGTVISTEFYHKVLSTSSPLENSQVLQSVKTANGAHIPVEGIATFDLGQTKYRCSAYVVSGLSYSVVLGRDFLQQNRPIINRGVQIGLPLPQPLL